MRLNGSVDAASVFDAFAAVYPTTKRITGGGSWNENDPLKNYWHRIQRFKNFILDNALPAMILHIPRLSPASDLFKRFEVAGRHTHAIDLALTDFGNEMIKAVGRKQIRLARVR